MSTTVRRPSRLAILAILAAIGVCIYGLVAFLSWEFDVARPGVERPILSVLMLLAAASGAYLMAIPVAARAGQHGIEGRQLLTVIVGPAIVFRIILLFSVPIQEIDIYRYLWDGGVSNAGVSPFQFSPDHVRMAIGHGGIDPAATDPDETRIIRMLDHDPVMADILGRVHFGELPTIYPPVSQVVFAASELTVPANSMVATHVVVMKAWMVGFDMLTLWILIGLLRLCGKPPGLCVIYAWCPLLLKEVANSGHLDAIAVCLTTLAVFLVVRLLVMPRASARGGWPDLASGCGVALVLALAVGAKLYPVVLAPLVGAVLVARIGWTKSAVAAAVFLGVTTGLMWPLLPRGLLSQAPPAAVRVEAVDTSSTGVRELPTGDPSAGVTTFLRRFEMNDFLFLLIVENLEPASLRSPDDVPWFSIVPDGPRERLATAVASWLGVTKAEAPFLCTRAITAFVFLVLAGGFAWRAARRPDGETFCEAAFLTLAWFWLLCPTQNPWYWTWVLPLLPFARSRVWLLMSSLVLLYYLRFWLSYHWPDTAVWGTRGTGAAFFDFVVTWIEFAPWFAALAGASLLARRSLAAPTRATRH